jgi:biotin transport system permease protein
MGVTRVALARHAPATGALGAVDGRVVLALSLLLGVLVWRGGVAGAAADAVLCGAIVASAGAGPGGALKVTARHAALALVWGAVKLGTALAAGATARAALEGAGALAVRLVALLLMGSAVTALLTPRALGLAAASLARPVLGRRAWVVALALSLMIHSVPRALASFEDARAALRLRRVRVSRLRAALLVVQAGLRRLAVGTWDQSLAIAARRLDRPEAWVASGPPRARDVAVGAVIATAAIALAGVR